MLVTYTTSISVAGDMTITLAASPGRITRILKVIGSKLSSTLVDPTKIPYLTISNCMNADGTAFTARWEAEEEGGGVSGTPRLPRSIVYDPPWRTTIKPGLSSQIAFISGGASAAGGQLWVGYKYE